MRGGFEHKWASPGNFFRCKGTIPYLDLGSDYMTLGICPNSQNCTPKRVNFTVYKFKSKFIKAKKKERKKRKESNAWLE